jgi:hypothetical protein
VGLSKKPPSRRCNAGEIFFFLNIQKQLAVSVNSPFRIYRWVLREYGHANQPHLVQDIQQKKILDVLEFRHTRIAAYGSCTGPRSRTTGQRLAGQAASSTPQ